MAAVSSMPRDMSAGPKPPPSLTTSTNSTAPRAPPATSKSSKTDDSFLKITSKRADITRAQRIERNRALHPNAVTREPASSNYQPRRSEIAPVVEPVHAGTGRAPVAPEPKRRRLSVNTKTHALPPRPNVGTPPTPEVGNHAERQSRWNKNPPTGPKAGWKATGANATSATVNRMPLLTQALAQAKSPKGNTSPPRRSWQQQGQRSPPQQQLPGWQTFQQHQQQQEQQQQQPYGYAPYQQQQYGYTPSQQHGYTSPQQHDQRSPYRQGRQSPYQRGNQSPYQRGNQSPYQRGNQSPYQRQVSGGRSPAFQREQNRSPPPLGQASTASGGNTPRPVSGGRTPPVPPLNPLPSRAPPAPRESHPVEEGGRPSSGAPPTPPHSPTPPPPSQSPPPPPPSKPATPTPASTDAGMRAFNDALEGLKKQKQATQTAVPVPAPQRAPAQDPAPAPPSAPRVYTAPVAATAAVAPEDERIAKAAEIAAQVAGGNASGLNLDIPWIAEKALDFLDALGGKRKADGSAQPPTPQSATATDVSDMVREASPRASKRARTDADADVEITGSAPPPKEPLFFDAPFIKIEDEDFGSLPNVPTQDELFGSEPDEDGPLFGDEEDEEDELDSDSDSDEDMKPSVDPRRQNPDMDVSDSEDDTDDEDIDDANEPIDTNAPQCAPKKRRLTKKAAKRAKLISEAVCAGQCFRCPNQPTFSDMYNHLSLDHRYDTLSPSDFKCDKILLCGCGRPAIKSHYLKNHLKFCSLPLEQKVALGMTPPKEKKTTANKAGTCHLCSKNLKDLLGHFKRIHANINVTSDDFDCPGLKACCGKVWTKGGRHKCADSSDFTRPSASTPSPQRAGAARATTTATARPAPSRAQPKQAPPVSRNINSNDGRNRRLSGDDGRPGELPDRLQFLNHL